jgi:hypothetical protein
LIIKKAILNQWLPTNDSVLREKKRVALEFFDGKCFVCPKKYGKGFAYHHVEYDPTRKTHSDFKTTIEYNRYVLPEIIAEPDRFYLLCKTCHARVDHWRSGQLGHLPKDQLARLFMVAYRTIPKPRKPRGR